MKTVKFGSKLNLNKETIVKLNEDSMSAIKGGVGGVQTGQPTVQGMSGCTGATQITGCGYILSQQSC